MQAKNTFDIWNFKSNFYHMAKSLDGVKGHFAITRINMFWNSQHFKHKLLNYNIDSIFCKIRQSFLLWDVLITLHFTEKWNKEVVWKQFCRRTYCFNYFHSNDIPSFFSSLSLLSEHHNTKSSNLDNFYEKKNS